MIVIAQYGITDNADASSNKYFVTFESDAVVIRDLDAEIQDGGNEIVLRGTDITDFAELLSKFQSG